MNWSNTALNDNVVGSELLAVDPSIRDLEDFFPEPYSLCTIALRLICVRYPPRDFPITKTIDEVIIHQPSRLHIRIRNRRADEAESSLLEILAECFGFGRSGWNLSRSFPAVEFGLPADELPAVGIKVAELFLDLEKGASIAHRGPDLQSVAEKQSTR